MRIVLLVCAVFSIICAGIAEMKVSANAKAATEAKSAAEKGDAAAQFRYAEMLRTGKGNGVATNLAEAVVWTRKAAEVWGFVHAHEYGRIQAEWLVMYHDHAL